MPTYGITPPATSLVQPQLARTVCDSQLHVQARDPGADDNSGPSTVRSAPGGRKNVYSDRDPAGEPANRKCTSSRSNQSGSTLPERELVTRFRHVYAGKGGWFKGSTSIAGGSTLIWSAFRHRRKQEQAVELAKACRELGKETGNSDSATRNRLCHTATGGSGGCRESAAGNRCFRSNGKNWSAELKRSESFGRTQCKQRDSSASGCVSGVSARCSVDRTTGWSGGGSAVVGVGPVIDTDCNCGRQTGSHRAITERLAASRVPAESTDSEKSALPQQPQQQLGEDSNGNGEYDNDKQQQQQQQQEEQRQQQQQVREKGQQQKQEEPNQQQQQLLQQRSWSTCTGSEDDSVVSEFGDCSQHEDGSRRSDPEYRDGAIGDAPSGGYREQPDIEQGVCQGAEDAGSRMTLMTQLSVEAQRALDETRQEMVSSDRKRCYAKTDRERALAVENKLLLQQVNLLSMPKTETPTSSANQRLESSSAQLPAVAGRHRQQDQEKRKSRDLSHFRSVYAKRQLRSEKAEKCDGPELSARVKARPQKVKVAHGFGDSPVRRSTQGFVRQSSFSKSGRLPQITSIDTSKLPRESELAWNSAQDIRVPNVIQYNRKPTQRLLSREHSFQITPAGYDSRFSELPIFANEEDETPSEVKAQAIEKCREWMRKYMT